MQKGGSARVLLRPILLRAKTFERGLGNSFDAHRSWGGHLGASPLCERLSHSCMWIWPYETRNSCNTKLTPALCKHASFVIRHERWSVSTWGMQSKYVNIPEQVKGGHGNTRLGWQCHLVHGVTQFAGFCTPSRNLVIFRLLSHDWVILLPLTWLGHPPTSRVTGVSSDLSRDSVLLWPIMQLLSSSTRLDTRVCVCV